MTNLRLTIVNVKVPLWHRILALFNGELVLAVMGTVQDVAVVTRSDAQQMLADSHQKRWVPFQESENHAPPPLDLQP